MVSTNLTSVPKMAYQEHRYKEYTQSSKHTTHDWWLRRLPAPLWTLENVDFEIPVSCQSKCGERGRHTRSKDSQNAAVEISEYHRISQK